MTADPAQRAANQALLQRWAETEVPLPSDPELRALFPAEPRHEWARKALEAGGFLRPLDAQRLRFERAKGNRGKELAVLRRALAHPWIFNPFRADWFSNAINRIRLERPTQLGTIMPRGYRQEGLLGLVRKCVLEWARFVAPDTAQGIPVEFPSEGRVLLGIVSTPLQESRFALRRRKGRPYIEAVRRASASRGAEAAFERLRAARPEGIAVELEIPRLANEGSEVLAYFRAAQSALADTSDRSRNERALAAVLAIWLEFMR